MTVKTNIGTKANRRVIIGLVIIGTIILLQTIISKWLRTESTDNAFVDGDISLISSEVNGIIENINFNDNVFVKKGEVILNVESIDYLAKFKQAEVAVQIGENKLDTADCNIKLEELKLDKLKSSLSLANLTIEFAEKTLARNTSLNKDSFSSVKLLDDAKINLEEARQNLKEIEVNIATAEINLNLLNIEKATNLANLEHLKQNLKLAERAYNNTQIKSPIDGVITNMAAKVGSYATVGVPLFAVVQNNKLTIKANFKETQIIKIKPGMDVEIKIDLLAGKKFVGKVRSVYPATGSKFSLLPMDNTTGNYTKVVQRIPVIIDMELPSEYQSMVIPGMSVVVSVNIG